MEFQVIAGIGLPFLGTALGAMTVFFLKRINERASSVLGGFAGGVMMAASVFSLILPAIERSASLGKFAFLPASVGFMIGIAAFATLDGFFPRISCSGGLSRDAMLTLAITLHNLPEGVAVGVVYAGLISGVADVGLMEALALSLGVGIQNFPEGAIISLPLAAGGMKKGMAFAYGIVSALVEVAGALFAIALTSLFLPALPYLLGFAAGAMIYVVVGELIPEATLDGGCKMATVAFSLGFVIMTVLDVALG